MRERLHRLCQRILLYTKVKRYGKQNPAIGLSFGPFGTTAHIYGDKPLGISARQLSQHILNGLRRTLSSFDVTLRIFYNTLKSWSPSFISGPASESVATIIVARAAPPSAIDGESDSTVVRKEATNKHHEIGRLHEIATSSGRQEQRI